MKASPALAWVPWDLTVLAFVALTVAATLTLLWSPRVARGVPPMVALAAVFALVVGEAPASAYADAKWGQLLALTMPAAIMSAIVVSTPERVWWLARWTLIWSALVAGVFLLAPSSVDLLGRYATEGGDTISTARGCGAGIVAAVALGVGRRLWWLVALGAVTGLSLVVLGTGSRGPLLAACVASLAALLLHRGTSRIPRLVGGTAFVVVVGPMLLANTNTTALGRIGELFQSDDTSAAAREAMYARALDIAGSTPQGIGWGGFELVSPGQPYPHNIFLEIALEAGWLAAILFTGLMVAAAVRLLRASTEPHAAVVLGLLLFWLTNALFSADVNGNRATFAVLAVALSVGQVARQARPRPRPVYAMSVR